MSGPEVIGELRLRLEATWRMAMEAGLWAISCTKCDHPISGKLAQQGEPSADELAECVCIFCGAVGEAKARYVSPEEIAEVFQDIGNE